MTELEGRALRRWKRGLERAALHIRETPRSFTGTLEAVSSLVDLVEALGQRGRPRLDRRERRRLRRRFSRVLPRLDA